MFKSHRFKRIMVILLAMLMITSLFMACAKKDEEKETATETKTEEKKEETKEEKKEPVAEEPENVVAEGLFTKYDPEITLVWGGSEAANRNYQEGESFEDNRWIDLVREKLGIIIEYAWVAPGAQYLEKSNVVIASGDIPDVMKVDATQLARLVDADLVNTDLQEVYDNNVSPTLAKDYMEPGHEGTFGAATFNGKLAAIPMTWSATGQGTQSLIIRNDWLEDTNSKPPTTIDELFELFDKFMAADFDGNGIDDTIGLFADKDLNGLFPLFWSFHAYPQNWIEVGGKIVYGAVQPEVKTALASMAEMYKRGYLDLEFAAQDNAKAMESILSSKAGVMFSMNHPWGAGGLIQENERADFGAFDIPSADGDPVIHMFPSFGNQFYAIRKGYENPEAVLKLTSYVMELAYGEGATYDDYTEYIQDYDIGFAPFTWIPWFSVSVAKNYRSYHRYLNGDPFDELNPEQQWIYDTIEKYKDGDRKQWAMARFFMPVEDNHYVVLDKVLDSKQYMFDAYYGSPLPAMIDSKSMVDDIFSEMAVKIIMGKEPIESFDNYVDQMNKAGLTIMTEEVNVWAKSK